MFNIIIHIIWCIVIGYLLGCMNSAFIAAKIRGFDIRTKGSGNAGASNAIITMGKLTGLFCALFDIFKAYAAVKICCYLFPELTVAGIIAGVCCILGHIFPVTMNFRGGKGLATLGGVAMSYNAKMFLALLCLEILIAFFFKYVCFVPTSASVIFLAILAIHYGIEQAIIFLPAVGVIFYKHLENFRRIGLGVEARFCYLWRKDEERQRIQHNLELIDDDRIKIDLDFD